MVYNLLGSDLMILLRIIVLSYGKTNKGYLDRKRIRLEMERYNLLRN